MEKEKFYSQNNEEKYIVEYFKEKKGVFVDIGGYDPFVFSNTRKLYEMGWSGHIVEPSPICFFKFMTEYEKEDRITLHNYALTFEEGVKRITFWDSLGDAVSTTHRKHKEVWEKGSSIKFIETDVEAVFVPDFFKNIDKKINFINLDVEGINYLIFKLIPDSVLSDIEMICIEHEGLENYYIERLQPFGFKEIMRNPENIIFTK